MLDTLEFVQFINAVWSQSIDILPLLLSAMSNNYTHFTNLVTDSHDSYIIHESFPVDSNINTTSLYNYIS